jgi:hypothetical protein
MANEADTEEHDPELECVGPTHDDLQCINMLTRPGREADNDQRDQRDLGQNQDEIETRE